MNGSLRGRLTRTLAALLVPLTLVLVVAIDWGVSALLEAQFDDGLTGRARDFATLLEREPSRYEFEFDDGMVPEYGPGGEAYFQIWRAGGPEVTRSASLGGAELPRLATGSLAAPQFIDLELPDARPGRAAGFTFIPRLDSDITARDAPRFQDPVVVTVAHDVVELHRATTLARTVLWFGGALTIGLTLLAAAWAVRRGLLPLRAVNAQIDAIDDRRLSRRIDTGAVPVDLRLPITRINELLGRLEASFERERRFSADVSHELRTPLAALRSVLEVARSRPRDPKTYRETIDEALVLTDQLQNMVENLLLLTASDADRIRAVPQPVLVGRLIDECWRLLAGSARERGLRFDNQVGRDVAVHIDPDLVRHVVRNLLANAVQYTAEGGRIVARSPGDGVILEIWDSGPQLDADVLERIFDRFWRADAARRDAGVHAGLGLPLARELARSMGCELVASNTRGGLAFSVECAERSPSPRTITAGEYTN